MFVRCRWWELLWYALWPAAKLAWEARLREGIEWSVAHPWAEIVIHEAGCDHRSVCTCGRPAKEEG